MLSKFSSLISVRNYFALGFLICLVMLAFALLFLQLFLNLEPCPLCVINRIIVIITGIIYFIAFVHNPKRVGQIIYTIGAIFSSGLTLLVAIRHVWLQNLPPDQIPNCGPDLSYLVKTLPLSEALMFVFKGSGSCAKVLWKFMGLSHVEWSLIGFIFLFIYALGGLFIIKRDKS